MFLNTLVLVSFFYNNFYVWCLFNINNYTNNFFWKSSAILNQSSLNIIIIIMLVLFFCKTIRLDWYQTTTKSILFYLFILALYNPPFYVDTSVSSFFFFKKINAALLNGVLNVHPWLIFTLHACMITLVYFIFFKKNKYARYNLIFLKSFTKQWVTALPAVAILLGAYWAFQELNWGGWWNWDIVELVSLNFFFIVLLLNHRIYDPNNSIDFKIFFKIIISFLITIVIIRFNLISSIHAFVSANTARTNFFKFMVICVLLLIAAIYGTNLTKNWSIKEINSYMFLKANPTAPAYFTFSLLILIGYSLSYILFVVIVESTVVELTYLIEVFLALLFIYFGLGVFKLQEDLFIKVFAWTPHPTTYLTFFVSTLLQQDLLKKSLIWVCGDLQHQEFVKKAHLLFFLFFTTLYFLKSHFSSFAKVSELLYSLNTTHYSTFQYGGNFIQLKFHTNATPFCDHMFSIFFYNFDFKRLDVHKEVFTQYYKNFLILYLNNFTKVLNPGSDTIILVYSLGFIWLGLIFGMYIISKLKIAHPLN